MNHHQKGKRANLSRSWVVHGTSSSWILSSVPSLYCFNSIRSILFHLFQQHVQNNLTGSSFQIHLDFVKRLPQQLPLLSTPAQYFAPIKLHLADEETGQAITGMSTTSSTDIVGQILFYNQMLIYSSKLRQFFKVSYLLLGHMKLRPQDLLVFQCLT